jgi:hypothetical protein
MDNTKIVPFGKYRGQPIEVLQADPDYVEWLRTQDWFSQKYPTINTLIINHFGEPDETPEHNALQARFLDDAFRGQVVAAWAQRALSWWNPAQYVITFDGCLFENKGWDVCLKVVLKAGASRVPLPPRPAQPLASSIPAPHHYLVQPHAQRLLMGAETFPLVAPWMHGSYMANQEWIEAMNPTPSLRTAENPTPNPWQSDHDDAYNNAHGSLGYLCVLHLELKPALGDDYPAVLRTMKTRQLHDEVRGIAYRDTSRILMIHAFTARGATLAQVRDIFALSNMTLITLADLHPSTKEY